MKMMKYFAFILAMIIFSSASAQSAPEYKLYYFHTTQRCYSCIKIEENTKKVYDEMFKDKMSFESINIEESENRHFINDYKLYTKSVVISKTVDGKEVGFKNLERVWYVLGSPDEFKSYIVGEVEAFMKE